MGGTDLRRLLERDAELEALHAAIAGAHAGGLVLIEGAPGIGKSSLVDVGAELGQEAGLRVLTARASQLETDVSFGVARQLLERPLLNAAAGERSELLEGAASLAQPVLSERPQGLAGAPSPDTAFAALHGLYWLSANLAERDPLLLAVDDLHWSDAPSLRYLALLAARLGEFPLVLLTASRRGEQSAEPVAFAELHSVPAAVTLSPSPLSEEAVERIVSTELAAADPEFARACHEAVAGNPFLLMQLVAELRREGLTPRADNAGRVRAAGPRAVSRSMLARLSGLPQAAPKLAAAVAVLGDSAELRHAAKVAGIDAREAAAAADALARAELFRRGEHLGFVHPVVRQAVYEDIGSHERGARHMSAARVLAAEAATPELVAAHLLQTEPTGDPWVVEGLRTAAAEAASRGAPDVAVAYLRRALREPPVAEIRHEVLLELGEKEALAHPETAVGHLSEALELAPGPDQRANTAIALGRTLIVLGAIDDSDRAFRQALTELGDVKREVRLTAEAEMLIATRHSISARPRLTSERLEALRQEAEPAQTPAERGLLGYLALHGALSNEPATVIAELAERALADGHLLAERAGDSPLYWAPVIALIFAEGFAAAEQACDAALEDARSRGSVTCFAIASSWRSNLHYRCGRLYDAEADARQSLHSAEEAWQFGVPLAAAFLADALIEQGTFDEAAAVLERGNFDELFPDTGGSVDVWLQRRGSVRVLRGMTRDGLSDILAAGRRHDAWGAPCPGDLAWRSQAALAQAALGQEREARRLADEELALARAFGARRTLGTALRVRALCEERERQVDYLKQAVEVLRLSAATLEHARALTDLGAALRRSNRRSDARGPLRQGLDLALRCGATVLAERASQELRATGARPSAVPVSGVDALTASERRVCQLAAEGLTNRNIAQALFVTLRTVETHLTSAYRKLDISSRRELREALTGEVDERAPATSR